MSQIAQQVPLKIEVTGGFADLTADQKTHLKDCVERGIIMDVELVSTTQGTSKIVSYATTVVGSTKNYSIIAVDSVASTPVLVAVALQ